MSDTAPPAAPARPGPDPAAKLRGVGGWLAWFAVTCFIAPLGMVGGTLAAWNGLPGPQMDVVTGLVPVFGFVRGFELAGVFTLGAALLVLGVCILQKRRFAALLAVVVLTVLLVFYASDVVLTRVATGQLGAVLARAGRALPQREPDDTIQIARAILATLLWLGYFLRSKRVAATFGPAGWRHVAAWVGGRGTGGGAR